VAAFQHARLPSVTQSKELSPSFLRQKVARLQQEKIDGFDESYHVSTLEDGLNKKDSTRQFRLPWLLIGTVDAYSSGAWQEKERTIRWIERALGVVDERTRKHLAPYEAAELLLALRYLDGELSNREAI
jgi:hypothetical protein